jgi:hypothetical protein
MRKVVVRASRVTDASEDLPERLDVLCTLDGSRSRQFGGLCKLGPEVTGGLTHDERPEC